MTSVGLGFPTIRSHRAQSGRPPNPDLIDEFGRVARDLRVSITEKCTLRCTYCMPEEGLPPIESHALLTASEIVRLVDIAVRHLGIREVRFTGGEPLVRRDLEKIIAGCRKLHPKLPLAMTTNAIGLDRRAEGLANAGLDRVNISLDTIDRDVFVKLTRRDRLPSVLAGIRAARLHGFTPVKVNAVLNADTLATAEELLQWCLNENVHLRFIEQMPLDADRTWNRTNAVTAEDLLSVLRQRFRLTPHGRIDPSAPAEEWAVDGGPARVGTIASVTRTFCADCDRTRLTAEGTIRPCLFSDIETDLRSALRAGASDEELAQSWRDAMWRKPFGHEIGNDGFSPPVRSMGAIGG
ncbi:cyclic pyranopterin phosphate synthase MoaA [Rhodococcus sp. SC4]|uniref:GTP 3',8-cyclase MoaA n=1 Tax=Rhodococcus koreensis TaxID=99653 RepID=UPI00076A6B1C|nr:GTP 3',8-cyclase MoaA [Rhodococcus koreensis]KXF49838.1 cyclic pyranopterin phosphate synthase MoaA [Rhodococcus sp. SC4]QSE86147.1 GTP 3',8-cyclase MoaA [Rhodococcus koreensis]